MDLTYFNSLNKLTLTQLIQLYGDNAIVILKTFKCHRNKDLEDFLINPNKALSFEKRKITKTYLFLDDDFKVVAYYSLALNIFSTKSLSKSLVKRLDGIDKNREQIASYLIAQLGKSDTCNFKIGSGLLNHATQSILNVSNIVGGRFIVIDAINNIKILDFYNNNNFIAIDDSSKNTENIRMYYPLIS